MPAPAILPERGGAPGTVVFEVLGPVAVRVAGVGLPLSSAKMRCLTAALVLHRCQRLTPAHLVAALWNGDPPASAQKNLHQYVHRLRRMLADHGLADRLIWHADGYRLDLRPGESDLEQFEHLTAAGRRARERGDLRGAARCLARALALWRADPLADVRGSLHLDEAAEVLAERRLGVLEERIGLDLRLGRHEQLGDELAGLVVAHPLRERLREYQMLALYAAGRRADALAVYQSCRLALATELGIAPGPAITELLVAMLLDDGATLAARLSPETDPVSLPGRRSWRRLDRPVTRPPGGRWPAARWRRG